jgi:hypothetical protein
LAEKMPEKVAEMKAKLDGWLKSVNAKMFTTNPNFRGFYKEYPKMR